MNDTTNSELDLSEIDDILNANMEDLDDLPPIGVPPSGHYNLTVTFSIEDTEDDKGNKRKTIFAKYIVDAINELKVPEEESEVAIGQEFREGFYLKKKDGTPNKFGIGTLKARLGAYSERFGTSNIGELITAVNQVAITATIKRKVNRKDEDRFNMEIKDVVVL
jgi:hypothetical protein